MQPNELTKGSAELLILSLLEAEARHGYQLSRLIEARSRGTIRFNVASLYPLLYRLESKGWVPGRWVEAAGERRRRFYRLPRRDGRPWRRTSGSGPTSSRRLAAS